MGEERENEKRRKRERKEVDVHRNREAKYRKKCQVMFKALVLVCSTQLLPYVYCPFLLTNVFHVVFFTGNRRIFE